MKPARDVIIIQDATRGDIVTTIDCDLYDKETISRMISNLFFKYIDWGLLIKVGSK